ncbi:hypothetical protein GKD93_07160 [Holdemania massiliensis]|uniref:PTS system mannose/fructose/sorbose family transporter subunit IID n=1 Tax=Holdemania massiliensis TaxID=1468449 RepID=A0A6N7S5G9_9FIRM|nr:hypothetical protein [Holdemania massiliensis]MSA89141.1 hypothetical protein [Holdemania massiliensis]MSB77970.1 hypothetical protein [Holdemania massiliensis]MSC32857.1 hypothetical protein [Holdemania massiliensis]MSC39216.1 hypothetical protein [Holdemania massiliensis]
MQAIGSRSLFRSCAYVNRNTPKYSFASNVSLSTPLTLNFGNVPFELQSAFDMIMPGFLPLMLSLLVIALLRKNIKANWIIIGMMVVAIAGRFIGSL